MSSPKSTPSPITGQSPKSHSSRRHSPASQASPGAQLDGQIEVDDDADSAYPESVQISDTSSLRSSIMNYKWENGRRYHAFQDGEYWGPNDEKQQDAEDLMHEVFRIVLDGQLFAAPIRSDPQKVLDLGCGTGLWAIEFADENPSAEVIGVDLSPIQPGFVPPNCRFEVDDINNEWTFQKDSFDLVHVRGMSGSVPDWVAFHNKILAHLKPGGWVEQVEISCIAQSDDGTIKPDSPLITWADVFKNIGEALGKTFLACETAHEAVKDAGFANVSETIIKLPIGTWPKDKQLKQWGAWNRQFLLQGLEGFSIRGLTDLLGWSFEEAQVLLARMRKELVEPTVHSYIEMRVIIGQRPETETEE